MGYFKRLQIAAMDGDPEAIRVYKELKRTSEMNATLVNVIQDSKGRSIEVWRKEPTTKRVVINDNDSIPETLVEDNEYSSAINSIHAKELITRQHDRFSLA